MPFFPETRVHRPGSDDVGGQSEARETNTAPEDPIESEELDYVDSRKNSTKECENVHGNRNNGDNVEPKSY